MTSDNASHRPMRILHLTDLFAPSIGGMEKHVLELVRERQKRGQEISVVTLQRNGKPSVEVEDNGYRVHRIGGGFQHFARAWESPDKPYHPPAPDAVVARELRRIISDENPDVVHAHNWMIYSYLAIKTRRSPPVLWMQHDYSLACPKKSSLYYQGSGVCPGPSLHNCLACTAPHYGKAKGAAVTLSLYASNHVLLRRVDRYVANSAAVAKYARHAVGASTQIDVVPSFVIGHDLLNEESRRKPAWLPPDGYLLFVGALGAHKGIHDLLRAYERLVGDIPPLVVIGTPKADSPKSWPDRSVVRLNVTHDEVMMAWKHCGFGIIPSRWPEPFGLVALEAALMGKAVVATRGGGLSEIVVNGETGILVPPGDVEELAGAMQRMIDDPALRQSLGQQGHDRARHFTVARMTDRLDAICMQLIRDRQDRG